MMAVTIETEREYSAGKPRLLFEREAPLANLNHYRNYDVMLDGAHFVMIGADEQARSTQINVVLNWFEELRRLVPSEH